VKFTVPLAALISALRIISPALSRTNPVRMASCAWIARDGYITMRAASFDWDVQFTVAADVATPGEVWMPADVMRALPWNALTELVLVRGSDREIEIRSGGITYTLPVLEPDSVVALAPAAGPYIEAPGSTLGRVLALGASAAHRGLGTASDHGAGVPNEPEREGAWLEIGRDQVSVSSTDRTRVAHAAAGATPSGAAGLKTALPVHAAVALARAASQAETATLSRTTREPSPTLTVAAGPATVTVRALASLPPDPTGLTLDTGTAPTRLRGRADALVAGLRAALAVAGTDPYATVQLRARKAHLAFQVVTLNGRASASVPLEHAVGADTEAVLPARALLAALVPLGNIDVTLGLGHPAHTVLIAATDGSVIYRGLIAASRKADVAAPVAPGGSV